MRKRTLSWLIVLTMVLSLIPAVIITATADDPTGSQYCVRYDNADGAQVKVGQNVVDSDAINDYTSGDAVEFTFLPPQGVSAPYRVDIEVVTNDGSVFYSTDSQVASDAQHTLTVSDNALSFDKGSGNPFYVNVWWSEESCAYDTFFSPFMVEFEANGNGTVTVAAANQVSYGNKTKVGFESKPASVSFTVTPTSEADSLEMLWI